MADTLPTPPEGVDPDTSETTPATTGSPSQEESKDVLTPCDNGKELSETADHKVPTQGNSKPDAPNDDIAESKADSSAPKKESRGDDQWVISVAIRGIDALEKYAYHSDTASIVPWNVCSQWETFRDRLEQIVETRSMNLVSVALEAFRAGDFVMTSTYPTTGIIAISDWSSIVKNGLVCWLSLKGVDSRYSEYVRDPNAVVVQKSSDSDVLETIKVEPVKEIDVPPPSYALRTSYTTEFYKKDYLGSDKFLHKAASDAPLPLKGSTLLQEMPVLEEIRHVMRRSTQESGAGLHSRYDLPADPVTSTNYTALEDSDGITKLLLQIHSLPLLNAIRSLVTYSSDDSSATDLDTGLFKYPFRLLYHYKDDLKEYAATGNPKHSDERNSETRSHVDHLVEYLYAQKAIRLAELEQSWKSESPVIAYNDLWLLFRPGTDVYVRHPDGSLEMYVLDALDGPVPLESGASVHSVACNLTLWNLDCDGTTIGRSRTKIRIGFYEGERPVVSLTAYPARFHVESSSDPHSKDFLATRGERFVRLCRAPTLKQYTGRGTFYGLKKYTRQRVMADHTSRPWELKELANFNPHKPLKADDVSSLPQPAYDSPYMRDANLAIQKATVLGARALAKGCRCEECRRLHLWGASPSDARVTFSDYDSIDIRGTHLWSQHQYMLCSARFYAFVFNDRLWDVLDVSHLEDPEFATNAINNLVMADATKNMIKAVCKTYLHRMSGKQFFTADFIEGKGEGQIFLLHGPPGTGKTLTAECVAEYTGRPLLSITAGDLGHEPDELERRLLRFFRNGNDWDAVVLLDEADIFLHERGDDDLKRNSIVSVFLRALDYFEGILFLTTNRVGVIDEAFKSRIHLQLGFPELDDKARSQIWANNFERLRQAEVPIVPDWTLSGYVDESPDVRELKLNGREIRNAFQTAVALAMDDDIRDKDKGAVLSHKHLSEVMRMIKEFRRYMLRTKGDDKKNAQLRQHRHDE